MDIRSELAGGQHRGDVLTAELYPRLYERHPYKYWWFASKGYFPHVFQAVFHSGVNDETGRIAKGRHLVAGRRGGKTLSAAWEILFYALHPQHFHRDVHGRDSDRRLWIWLLIKDYPTGWPSIQTLLDVMRQAGLVKGRDYEYNKTERRIEFTESGSIIQFRTAEDPQSLRGAGLDILWIDEAAFIESADAWVVVFPALADQQGVVITTTTPWGKNWFYEEWFAGPALEDPDEFRVQYTSLDNPFLPDAFWKRAMKRYHPMHFRQEFLASFDAFTGIALQGEWLKYWVAGNPDLKTGDISLKRHLTPEGRYRLRIFMGIDPAISLSDDADHFAIAVIGFTEDMSQGYLLDTFKGRVAFPEQLDLIEEWFLKWRPELIGVEANAFQIALAQQASRLEGFPGIVPVFSKGKKNDRILSMSPLFKIGRVRIHKSQADFIDQWINFDPEKKNQKDDVLDAVEIALGVAGVLLPMMPHEDTVSPPQRLRDIAHAQIKALRDGADRPYDPELGSEA